MMLLRGRRRLFTVAALVALPVVLLWTLMAQMSWQPRLLHRIPPYSTVAAWSPNSEVVAVGAKAGLELWNVTTKSRTATIVSDDVGDVVFSSDDLVAVAHPQIPAPHSDAGVSIYDAKTGKRRHRLNGYLPIAFLPGTGRFMSGSGDGFGWGLTTWNSITGQPIKTVLVPVPKGLSLDFIDTAPSWSPPLTLFLSANGSWVGAELWQNKAMSASAWRGTLLFDPNNPKRQHILPPTNRFQGSLCLFSPSGDTFVRARESEFQLWETRTGRLRLTVKEKTRFDSDPLAALSADGNLLATADGYDKIIHLRDARTGHLLRQLRGHQKNINSIVFSPDSCTLASSDKDGFVYLWRVK